MSGAKPAAHKAAAPSAKLDPTLASRLPLRVLLCDDNIINQKVALRLLQQMGYRADLAANGLEALAALDRQPYDLIFMDVMMPEMGGLEATRLIRERQKQRSQFPNYKSPIIIVAMTASAMQGDREKCLRGRHGRLRRQTGAAGRCAHDCGTLGRGGRPGPSRQNPRPPDPEPLRRLQTPRPAPAPRPAPPEDAPVDMARLLDFTDGDPDNLRELVTLYLDQTSEQVEQLEAAVRAGAAQEVRRLAHSCAGASATCGMRRLVPLLRELERQGFEGKLTNADPALPSGRRGIRTHPPLPGGLPRRALHSRRQSLTMKKILIVEDDQIVANIYRNKFSRRRLPGGDRARTGRPGWTLIHSFQPDAVILDLMLPKITGVELMKKIRAEPEFQQTARDRLLEHLPDQYGPGSLEGRRHQVPFQGQLHAQASDRSGAQRAAPATVRPLAPRRPCKPRAGLRMPPRHASRSGIGPSHLQPKRMTQFQADLRKSF